MTKTLRAGGLAALTILALIPGCGLTGPDCINEHRNVTLDGTTADGVRYYVSLDEERVHSSKKVVGRRITWAVFGAPAPGTITAIHLRQGSGGQMLADLPVTGGTLQGDVFEPGFLSLSYDEVFAIFATQPVFAEMRSQGSTSGQAGVVLPVQYNNPWVHAYCS